MSKTVRGPKWIRDRSGGTKMAGPKMQDQNGWTETAGPKRRNRNVPTSSPSIFQLWLF